MSKRILVVEDQPDNRQIIRDMLAPTDYEIAEVESGEEALTAIAKQRPDLILMDIRLPIMDGYTATSQTDPALRSIPIIAVTSYALSGEEKKARAAGCDDFDNTQHDLRSSTSAARSQSGARRVIPLIHRRFRVSNSIQIQNSRPVQSNHKSGAAPSPPTPLAPDLFAYKKTPALNAGVFFYAASI